MEWLSQLFDCSGFVPRRTCGMWTTLEVAIHNVSDLVIFASYLAIPFFLIHFVRKRHDAYFPYIFYLFGLFIISCGFTHLMEFLMFYWPAYRLAGIVKVVTAVASAVTVIALWRIIPKALALKSPAQLEKMIEDMIGSRIAELAHSNQRKDEFMLMLGHELRNPLAAIFNAKRLLMMPSCTEEIKVEALEILNNQCEHLTRLVDDVIHVTRAVAGKIELRLEEVLAHDIIERGVQLAEPLIEAKRHKLVTQLPCNGTTLLADKIRLVQVVGNLLTNAAKYTPAGGKIEISCVREYNDLVIRVKDSGIGIEKKDLREIFDLCVRTERAVSRENGLGLGLTMVKAIVEEHGGTVFAESEGHDTGSTFTVKLPIKENGNNESVTG